MMDRIYNCSSTDVEHFCTGLIKTSVRIVMMLGTIIYIWLSYIILGRMQRECTRKWTQYDYQVFIILYITFSLSYVIVFEEVMKPFQCIWYFMVRLYRCMRFCMRYLRNHARLPTRSDFRRIFPIKRAINRNQLQPEITNSANELNDDKPPPLPPRNRVVTEPRTTMFQKLTSKLSAGVKSRTTVEDENPDLSSCHLQRPRCSKHSTESSRRRGKKLTKRSHFKNMMSKVTNLQAINEEDLDPQGASGIKVPLSVLTQNSSSDSEREKETSFTVESYQYGGAGQDFDYINNESDEQAPTQRVYGIESQFKPSSIRDEQSDQTSESPEQLSTSGCVPFFNIWNPTSSPRKLALIDAPVSKFGTVAQRIHLPLSSVENLTQDDLCSSQEKQTASDMQNQSLERLPELGSQSRPFDTCGTENQTIHQPLVSTCSQVSQPQTQSSTFSLSGSQEHSQMSHIQKAQGKGDQAGPRYVKLAQLEEQLAFSDVRIENKQSSPEQSALRDVSIPLQSQVSSMPGVQKMPSYQEQTSSAGVSDLQKHGRISDVQKRRLSRKHSPIPSYRKYSDSERQSPEETLNLLQPIQSRTQFYSAENQLQASGIGPVHESSLQERGLQEKSLQEASTPKTSRTSNSLEKLRNLYQASAAGFPVATSEIRQFGEDPALPLLADYAGEKFRGKAERANKKRRGSLSLVSERPVCESNTRKNKTGFVAGNTSGLSDSASGGLKTSSIKRQQILSSGYTSHSVLPWSGGTPTQALGASTTHKTEGEDQFSQQSQRDLLHLHEMYKVAAERKTFLTLALATGGLVLSNDGAEEFETGADSSEQSYMYDQPTDILDLTHIEVPLPPIKIYPSKDEHQNLDIPTLTSSSRTKTAEESIENTPPLSTCAREGLKTLSGQMQQIESQGGYTPHALPSTSTQTQVVTIPPKDSEGRIGKQSQRDPLHLKETDKEETQKTSCMTHKLATGGLLLSKDGAENNETKAELSETLYTYDQPIGPLDLTHIKVPLLRKYKGKDESQISKEPIHEISTRTCITEQSVESTLRLSACASGGVESSSTQKQQIEASEGGYATHSTLPTSGDTSTPTHVLNTLLKRKEVEYRIGQLSSKDSSLLKETEMLEAEKKETFLTLDLVTGGIVISNEREDGTEADSSETSFMYDQPMDALDLTHIKVHSLSPKDKKASKGKKEHQN